MKTSPPAMTDAPDPSDAELLARLRVGDASALDALLQRYWSAVVAYVGRMAGSPDVAEDIAQRTFLRIWERRESWRARGSVRGLVYRIAHNFAVSHHRSELARARAHTADGELAIAPQTPLAALEGDDLREALDRAVQALPPRRREVFVLRCVHDLSYKEIADVMRISPQTVANQLSRAIATLRESLQGLLEE